MSILLMCQGDLTEMSWIIFEKERKKCWWEKWYWYFKIILFDNLTYILLMWNKRENHRLTMFSKFLLCGDIDLSSNLGNLRIGIRTDITGMKKGIYIRKYPKCIKHNLRDISTNCGKKKKWIYQDF